MIDNLIDDNFEESIDFFYCIQRGAYLREGEIEMQPNQTFRHAVMR